MSNKAKFLSELKALLEKYDVTIDAGVGGGSDTHGIYDETIFISHRISPSGFRYEDWLEVSGWSLGASDIPSDLLGEN